jgi:tripartite-type tricarboxylate transporter receptor subunit TctC
MTLARRSFLRFAAGAAAFPTVSRIAMAQTYPLRPVRVIVSFAAGGPTDILARLIGEHLSQRLGQQFVIENKPGAGGNIGAETVARAEPDGYTLLMIDATPTISATLYDKLNFNFVRDIVPIAGVARVPQVILVHPSVPAKTLPDLITYAKANPGKINMASAGIGTPPHMAGELFKLEAGINLVHVPYRGTGAVSRYWRGNCRSTWRACPNVVVWAGCVGRLYQERQTARAGSDQPKTPGRPSGSAQCKRVRAGL